MNPQTKKIINLLQDNSITFQTFTHRECRTSEQSRQLRLEISGKDVIGAKAILMKVGNQYPVFVLPGDRKIDSKALKKELNIKDFRFATPAEMAELTDGLVPGSMPPFSQAIFPNLGDLYIDASLLNYPEIGFNAGSLTQSIIVNTHDYVSIAQPTAIFNFSLIDIRAKLTD